MQIMETLETHYKDLCDIEFTIERGQLWMLQTRVGKRTAGAAFRIATQLVDQGLIDEAEALQRVNGAQLAQLMFPRFDDGADSRAARPGHRRLAGRGGRQGRLRLVHRRQVVALGREGHPDPPRDQPRRPRRHDRRRGHPHLARRQDLARRRRRPRHGQDLCLRRRGAGGRHQAAPDDASAGTVVEEGDVVSIDGSTGKVYLGEVPGRAVPGRRVLRGPDARGRRRRRRAGRGRAPDHGVRRPHAPAAGARQRRQRRGRARAPAASAPRASACAAPSTCSSASAARWSSG